MDEPTKRSAPGLRCLRGAALARQIAADIDLVKHLPQPAREQLYRVLGPYLPAQVPPSAEAQLDHFAQEFGVPRPELGRAVRACRFLLRQAATTNLGPGEFVEDLAALGDAGELSEALLSGYDSAVKLLRLEIAGGTIADHGKIVEHVSWRVDRVELSDRGDDVGVPVLMLTLGYRDGDLRDRITLQIPAEALLELRVMCDRIR